MTIQYGSEVRTALDNGKPLVALESTVIAQGLPRPQNIETARALEDIVRAKGAVPATIAIIDGVPLVGLDEDQLDLIANNDDIHKMSIRDLGHVSARKLNGATTVASTVHIATLAGIKVFATGGIGGVHRGFEADVSADLPTLASRRMVVVCAGAKSVLDLGRTRERLETDGVTVIGWKTESFPAFYKRDSGFDCDVAATTAEEVAAIWKKQVEFEIPSSLLVTAPVPASDEMDPKEHDRILNELLRKAGEETISGKEITPFLLKGMSEQSKGVSLATNIALLKNNAEIAAQIAVAMN